MRSSAPRPASAIVALALVAVTYCPRCASGVAFDRRAGDRILSFGTSGMLYLSDLVMYDRQTESPWPQIEGAAVAGALTGTQLTVLPAGLVSWEQWREAHPDGWVLSRQTGHDLEHGGNPCYRYEDKASPAAVPGGRDRQPGRVAEAADPRDRLARDRCAEGAGRAGGHWWRSYGNESWEFDADGYMRRREASINDVAIEEADRRIRGPRADDERGQDIPLGL